MILNLNSFISENKEITPQGYLICHNVPISRVGIQEYLQEEIPFITSDNGIIYAERLEADVFDIQSIQSFENLPFTEEHPNEEVNSSNWQKYAVGTVKNVRKDGIKGVLLADIIVYNQETIEKINNGIIEISCGYSADYEETGIKGHVYQKNIRGNHVALVTAGRCGSICSIHDLQVRNKNTEGSMEKPKKSLIDKLKSIIIDEETIEKDEEKEEKEVDSCSKDVDIQEVLQKINERLDKLEEVLLSKDEDKEKSEDEDIQEENQKQMIGNDEEEKEETKDENCQEIAKDSSFIAKVKAFIPDIDVRLIKDACYIKRWCLNVATSQDVNIKKAIKDSIPSGDFYHCSKEELNNAFLLAYNLKKSLNNDRYKVTSNLVTEPKKSINTMSLYDKIALMNANNKKFYENIK